MTKRPHSHRRAAVLLLTAAALSFTPALAQDAQPPAEEPVVDTAPPPVPQPVETVTPSPEPVAADPLPTAAPIVETQQQPAPAARTTRTAPRAAARAPARAPVRAAPAPAAAPAASAPAAAPAEALPPAAPIAEGVPPAVVLPETPAAVPPAQAEQGGGSILPWLIAGLLAAAALAFFLLRRRRGAVERDAYAYDESAPAAAAIPAAAAAAVPMEDGVPALDLALRPCRAGVTGDAAMVEFELDVANRGTAAARDVRVSTFMFPAGTERTSEAERALIERPAALRDIAPGEEEHISRSVTLPTSEVASDAVLPVVVAEARYRLPDGTEASTSATYAVGVPDGDELAHFDVENPSGLHDDVVARELGRTEPAA